jgi:group I intron endonuclease
MSSSIYRITNKVNGKFYIGKTTKPVEQRFKTHIYNSKKQNTHLYHAMRKYGIDQFVIEQLELVANHDLLNEKERYWIAQLSPQYNMTIGGDGGNTSSSPNYKFGMAKRDLSGNKNPMYGRKRNDTSKFLSAAKDKMMQANRCPVICEGIQYPSVGDAQTAYPGCNIRKRLDNPRYPNFYRLRERTKRK